MNMRGDPIRIYLNRPAPCPYLANRIEQRLLIPLAADDETAAEQLGFFTQLGFRRSQNVMYRPQCPACTACISYRLVTANFKPSATQARTARRNRDLIWEELNLLEAAATLYPLFTAYQAARHNGSDMAQFSEADFHTLLQPATIGNTCFVLREPRDGNIIAAILTDRVGDGLSAVYSFYNPGEVARSLGTELVMRLVEQARREKIPYIYLGYWIEESPKMSYKSRFGPAEILTDDGWVALPPKTI